MEENKTQGEEVEVEKVVSEEQHSQNSSSAENVGQSDVEKNKMIAILSYLIFFLPFLTDAKDSKFARFHANQSLVLWIFSMVTLMVLMPIITLFLSVITLGLFLLISPIVFPLVALVFIGFGIVGMINANNGEMKRLPIIGGIDIIK